MPYYYGFDTTYILVVLPCILLAVWASSNVNSTFKKYANQISMRHISGAEAARRVLSANGVTGSYEVELTGLIVANSVSV